MSWDRVACGAVLMLPLVALVGVVWMANRAAKQVDYKLMSNDSLMDEMSWAYSCGNTKVWSECSAEMSRRHVDKTQRGGRAA